MIKQKTSILQMFYGQRGDGDKMKCSPEYEQCRSRVNELYSSLREKLQGMPEVLALLEKFNELSDRLNILEGDALYEEGFKFGLLIGVEAGESKFEIQSNK